MGFLSGLQGLFDPNRLAVAQAFASGDYQGAAVLRARQDELQRQRAVRDAQVIGAKNLGIDPDEIGAMTSQDLSRLAQERAAMRMFAPQPGGADGGDEDGTMKGDGTAQPGPKGWPLRPVLPDTLKGSFGSMGVDAAPPGYGAPPKLPQVDYGVAAAGKGLASLLRAGTADQAAALPPGCLFLAPNGSIRKKL